MTADIQANFAAIRALLDKQTVACPQWHIREQGICMTCERYKTTSPQDVTPPDPRYEPLRAVVLEECPCWCHGSIQDHDDEYPGLPGGWKEHRKKSSCCHNTGLVLRSWDGLPPGALAGALFCAATPLEIEGFDLSTFASANPDAAAVQAVRKALEEKR